MFYVFFLRIHFDKSKYPTLCFFVSFSIDHVSLHSRRGWRGSGTWLRCYVDRKVGRAGERPTSGGGTRRERRSTEEPVVEWGAEDELRDVAQRPAKTTKFVQKWKPCSGRRRGIDTTLKMGKKLRVIHHLSSRNAILRFVKMVARTTARCSVVKMAMVACQRRIKTSNLKLLMQ